VVWVGRFRTLDGYGTAAQLHVNALRRIGITVVCVDLASQDIMGSLDETVVDVCRSAGRTQINALVADRPIVAVLHDRPDRYDRVTVSGRARVAGFSYWETVGLPPNWSGWMSSMDEIWAASPFNRRGFAEAGVPEWMIKEVGHPVDPLIRAVADTASSYRQRWSESTVFLSLVSSVNTRRDLTLLIEAFIHEFDANDDVALVLKGPTASEEVVSSIIGAVAATLPSRDPSTMPTIHTIAETLSREQLARLHASVDCYVSCERGDGWDLPAMDSIALGVPVVASDFGASTAFLHGDDCYLVEVSDTPVACNAALRESHPLYDGHEWPYFDAVSLGKVLRRVHTNPDERRQRGRSGAARIRDRYAEAKVASNVWAILRAGTVAEERSSRPASVVVSQVGHGWTVPVALPLAESSIAAEVELLARLFGMAGGGTHPKSPFVARFRSAVRYAAEQGDRLNGTPTRSALSQAMRVKGTSPVRKAAALRRLHLGIPRIAQRFGGPQGLDDLRFTIAEYAASLSGEPCARAPEVVEESRRRLWSLGGPFRTPEPDLSQLALLRNRHLGERVFILGNGPSLTRCDLSALKGEFTFGVNKIHLLFDQIDWRPSFYTLLDWKMGAAVAADVSALDESIKFFPERFRGVLPTQGDVYWYWPRAVGSHIDDQFEPDATKGIPSRATVLVTAIQQAFFLGFREIILIGVDASYTIPESVKQSGPDQFGTGTRLHLESTADDDPNHFSPSYFGAGDRWHDPNADDMHRMFRIMRKGVERHGGRLLNATVGGSLEQLQRADYSTLF